MTGAARTGRAARAGFYAAAALSLFAGASLVALQAGASGTATDARSQDTVRIALRGEDVDSMDPALAYAVAAWTMLDTTCALLLRKGASPHVAAREPGLQPEVASGFPRVSRDGRTYTFTLRRGFRFSDGTPVRASAFARAINRTLAPGVRSPWAAYSRDIVGAEKVVAGKATEVSGVVARGYTLVVRLARPVPEFPFRTTTWCAVPPALPSDREGVGAFPAAGPYYVAEYRPAETVVIRRNPFYGGTRTHHVEGFTADLRASSFKEVLDRVERGDADWGWALPEVYFDPARRLAAKYGVNRSRFFVQPGSQFFGFALNTSRPLFRDNLKLRQAVNFAIDRSALHSGRLASRLTDQYLPPSMPGFEDTRIYPLGGPNLRRARALAEGNTRSRKAVLYTVDSPLRRAAAQTVRQNLAEIGLDVEIEAVPLPAYFGRLGATGPYDIGFAPWVPDFNDPYGMLNVLFDGRFIGSTNWARFDSPEYNRLLRRAAGLTGAARYRAYAALDARLARDAAPMVAVEVFNDATLVSKRVGCVRLPFDLTAICLR